jgi:hypothetical protein
VALDLLVLGQKEDEHRPLARSVGEAEPPHGDVGVAVACVTSG